MREAMEQRNAPTTPQKGRRLGEEACEELLSEQYQEKASAVVSRKKNKVERHEWTTKGQSKPLDPKKERASSANTTVSGLGRNEDGEAQGVVVRCEGEME